ncbi:hypothetical protein AVEN_25533-1 [Araneus ventricosus]|uniref:Tc1-like transposase DDE domain-containing protein n=1 Tax=Araneus ventricosus TaxID=182803 RepID=A0A4Y2QC58_ARAVE|nr:hypothetical protein AVEN_25533-1 [Araneus ventricosus]
MQTVQKLQPNYRLQRVAFTAEMLSRIENEHDFLNRIIFTDEAKFHVSNKVNISTTAEFLAQIKPHAVQEVERNSPKINGRGFPIAWPPRSPDLTPLDYFFWGYVKHKVYSREIRGAEDFRASINAAIATVTTEIPQRTWLELDYPLDILRATKGDHVEVHRFFNKNL